MEAGNGAQRGDGERRQLALHHGDEEIRAAPQHRLQRDQAPLDGAQPQRRIGQGRLRRVVVAARCLAVSVAHRNEKRR